MRPLSQAVVTIRGLRKHPANKGHPNRAVMRYLGWQLWQRSIRRPLAIRFEGLKLVCFPHEQFSSAVLYNGFVEWQEMHFVKAFLRPGDFVVDVGANVGVYTLLAASVPDVEVYSFEPVKRTYGRLVANVERNNLRGRVTTFRAAVGDTKGVATVTNRLGPMNRITREDESGESVALVRLDDEVSLAPMLIKVDVEGHELSVLRGAVGLLERHHPVLVLEANDRMGLRDFLAPLGYSFYEFEAESGVLHPSTDADAANVIAISNIDDARARLLR